MMNKIKQGDLSSASEAKRPNDKLQINANQKITQGSMNTGKDARGKSKSKVDPAIFKMAEQRDY